jgi:hypothetical protein
MDKLPLLLSSGYRQRTGRGTEHSNSTRCQGPECMALSYTPHYVLMTCSFISTGETSSSRFRLYGYVITRARGRCNSTCALQCLKAQALSNVQHFTWTRHNPYKKKYAKICYILSRKKDNDKQRTLSAITGFHTQEHLFSGKNNWLLTLNLITGKRRSIPAINTNYPLLLDCDGDTRETTELEVILFQI